MEAYFAINNGQGNAPPTVCHIVTPVIGGGESSGERLLKTSAGRLGGDSVGLATDGGDGDGSGDSHDRGGERGGVGEGEADSGDKEAAGDSSGGWNTGEGGGNEFGGLSKLGDMGASSGEAGGGGGGDALMQPGTMHTTCSMRDGGMMSDLAFNYVGTVWNAIGRLL